MSRHFVVSAIYGPPITPIELILKIDKFIGKLDDDYEETYILGDLDCILLDQGNFETRKLHKILELCQLTQLIDKPNRIKKTSRSLLVICITSCPKMIVHSDVIRVGFCDHDLVYLVQKIKKIQNQTQWNKQKLETSKNLIAKISFMIWERNPGNLKRDPASRGVGGGRSYVARLNVKTSRSVFINTSRRSQKLNENSLSLSGFRKEIAMRCKETITVLRFLSYHFAYRTPIHRH